MSFSETPGANRSDVVLEHSIAMLAPLVRVLIANSVTYPQLVAALKPAFLHAANAELEASGKRISDSAVSIVCGVHRKDVRTLKSNNQPQPHVPERTLSLACEVVARWCSGAPYSSASGEPRALPVRSGNDGNGEREPTPSFEQLTKSVTRDFHSRAVLEELLRLGVVKVVDNTARLDPQRLVADQSFIDAMEHAARSIHQQLATIESHLSAAGERQRIE